MIATVEDRPRIDSQDYSAEGIADWLYERNIKFRFWFNTQYQIIGLYITEGLHDKARFYFERATEISDHLRARGAMHLLH